ncbi:DUF481 domain-containing protein [Citreimonas sp.]|uniref:DUF481 domain-containing protein n=1 Tax=Citreimonas sp. TaxID=3036715 RepID=UPI0040589DFB
MGNRTLPYITLAGIVAFTPAFAQTAFDNTDIAEDRNEALAEDIEDDFERDIDDFGNRGRALGFDGSVALRGSATSGNSDDVYLGIGSNLGYYDGTNGYTLRLNYTYAEDEGDTTEESLFYDFQYTRDFTSRAYGFAKVQGTVDEFSAFDSDTFVGIGAGYWIYDQPTIKWAVQGGPGYRVAELDDALDADFEEEALSLSSAFSYQISPTTFMTNDTDIIGSESDTVIYNEIGLNVALNDTLALRTSLGTEYHTDPQDGFDDTDNTLGVSLVIGLN